MGKQVAFLRAINVGGHRVLMDELSALFEGAGLVDVQPFLASGNVVFNAVDEDQSILEKRLEAIFEKHFGFESQVMIRSMEEIQTIKDYEAFPAADIEQAGAYNVAFMKGELSPDVEKRLLALQNNMDQFHVHGTTVYWLCAVKQSESKFSNAILNKTIKTPVTMRGMKTVEKIIKKFA